MCVLLYQQEDNIDEYGWMSHEYSPSCEVVFTSCELVNTRLSQNQMNAALHPPSHEELNTRDSHVHIVFIMA